MAEIIDMKIYENEKYLKDVEAVAELPLPWEKLKDSSVFISGASGMIGSCLIDVIFEKNKNDGMNCAVHALGRNEGRARERFGYCWGGGLFHFIPHDINKPLQLNEIGEVGYVLHLASQTHPVAYATDPIGTVTTNIIGANNMLSFAAEHHARRFLFASSNEIYGESRGDAELFDEQYCGYIDPNTMRAGYPESKRCGESLCQAYIKQTGLDVVIPRFTRSYGPTMLMSDTKAISQFIKKGIAGEDIVLKSTGEQYYSYTYVTDAVAGLLTVLLCGKTGEAYNIADESGDITLRDLANIIAGYAGTKVVFDIPDELERSGYSTATKARLDGTKIRGLGWKPRYGIAGGMKRTLEMLKEIG